MLTNPVVISIVVMTALCLLRFNILLSILVSALVAGLIYHGGFGGVGAFFDALTATTSTLITGMKGNLETSLSYILLGALAAAIANTNLTAILINAVSKALAKTSTYFALIIRDRMLVAKFDSRAYRFHPDSHPAAFAADEPPRHRPPSCGVRSYFRTKGALR